ncbi:RHS repeat domain-containing protein, partial [Paenibacillus periandrae]|uniref:RHS repeat domain-containing protein n=1 Tax=Paenibacillus periandrae TaxID=1761741 RepID=UPI001F08E2A3
MKRICLHLLIMYFMVIFLSSLAMAESKYNYDSNGILTDSISSLGSINYSYDANGNLLSVRKSDNLLTNGSFETYQGSNGVANKWEEYKWGANGSYEVSPISASEHAQKIIGSGIAANGAVGVVQTISAEPNKKFHVSGSFNIVQLSNAKIQLYVDFYNSTMFTGASV